MLSAEQLKAVRVQCAIPVAYVNEQLIKRNGIRASIAAKHDSGSVRMFLASDHENMVLERALVNDRGAVMYQGKFGHKSLLGLALDFFVMAGGEHFSGNQLSSISQNVCFVRLGLGLRCLGFVAEYALHLSAPLAAV